MKKSTSELLEIMKSKKDYKEFFSQEVGELNFKTITEYLEILLEEKKLNKSDVIKKANLDKNYAYQIFNGTKTNPGRDKIIMLAFGMDLNLEETRKLLKISNLRDLYERDPRDSIIIFGLLKGKSLMDTNEMLNDYGLEILE